LAQPPKTLRGPGSGVDGWLAIRLHSGRNSADKNAVVDEPEFDWKSHALRSAVVVRDSDDERDEVTISGDEQRVLSHLWEAVNHQFDLLIGEYESEIIPVEMLLPLAEFLVTMTHATPTSGTIRLPWTIWPAHSEAVSGIVEVELNAIYNRIWDIIALLHRAAKANQRAVISW
jgi:hypothetical protein